MTAKGAKGGNLKASPPIGNKNQSPPFTGRWREAIDKATKRYSCAKGEGNAKKAIRAGTALDEIAMRLVELALFSDDYAFSIKEIGLRLDGKPTEHKTIDVSTAENYAGVSEALGILHEFARRQEDPVDEDAVSH